MDKFKIKEHVKKYFDSEECDLDKLPHCRNIIKLIIASLAQDDAKWADLPTNDPPLFWPPIRTLYDSISNTKKAMLDRRKIPASTDPNSIFYMPPA